jgi:hypothetical protein
MIHITQGLLWVQGHRRFLLCRQRWRLHVRPHYIQPTFPLTKATLSVRSIPAIKDKVVTSEPAAAEEVHGLCSLFFGGFVLFFFRGVVLTTEMAQCRMYSLAQVTSVLPVTWPLFLLAATMHSKWPLLCPPTARTSSSAAPENLPEQVFQLMTTALKIFLTS